MNTFTGLALVLLIGTGCKNELEKSVAMAPSAPSAASAPSAPVLDTAPAAPRAPAPAPEAAPAPKVEPKEKAPTRPVVGKLAPEIIGEDIDGKPIKLSDYRGKVVMLDFWGHW